MILRAARRTCGPLLLATMLIAGAVLGAAAGPATPAKVPVPGGAGLDDQTRCLALAVYWEAKAEPPKGQAAIAHAVLNRTRSAGFPDSVCGVVAQGAKDGGKGGCQFSWWCDGKRDEPREAEAWKAAIAVARAAESGKSRDPTGGALYFHASGATPAWASAKTRLARIGHHVFYR